MYFLYTNKFAKKIMHFIVHLHLLHANGKSVEIEPSYEYYYYVLLVSTAHSRSLMA